METVTNTSTSQRWFWNSSYDPWDTEVQASWTPYPHDTCFYIEQAFQKHQQNYEYDNFIIEFDLIEGNHQQFRKGDKSKQRCQKRSIKCNFKCEKTN